MRTYIKPHCAGEEWEVFFDDADGVRSQVGWYYENAQGVVCGPFHAQHAAEQSAESDQSEAEE